MSSQPVMSMGPAAGGRRAAIVNSSYAVADYVTQPLGMLVAAPYLLQHMGAGQFGVWMLASAAVSSGSLLSSGFGDAAVKYVSMYRGRDDWQGVTRIVRGMITINLALSSLLAIILSIVAPYAVSHIAHIDGRLQRVCLESFRIGSLLLVVRSLDSVFVSTLRAFERYSPAVRIAMYSRVSALLAAVLLVSRGFGVASMMVATLVISGVAVVAQGIAVRVHVGKIVMLPSLHRETISTIAGFGCFSWLQALASVAFSQVDRLVVGVFLGAPAVAYYGICSQAAQPIHGIVGSALHVLFPHLSSRLESRSIVELRATIFAALKANVLLAVLMGVPVVVLSRTLLSWWMGAEFARMAWPVLSILAASFILLGLNVTGFYTLLALGQVRLVTWISLGAGAVMLALMVLLTPRFGMVGTASARLVIGPITWAMYLPLRRMLRGSTFAGLGEGSPPVMEGSLP
jgi:O-antigen/teichoic acid export membrane protein